MTGEGAPGDRPVGGLITQRMAVERGRTTAIFFIIAGCVNLLQAGMRGADLLIAVQAGTSAGAFDWMMAIVWVAVAVALCVYGGLQLRARSRRIAQFDATHGVDAGKQPRSRAQDEA